MKSLEFDHDLRITIKLVGFLFLTERVPWTDTSLVGHPEFETYKGREVLVTSRTIKAFGDWMERKSFPFEYDHAVGLFK